MTLPLKASEGMTLLFLAVAFCIILFSPDRLAYDEVFYHHYASDLIEKGFGGTYVKELKAAPGPLYGIVHAIGYPLTQGDPVGMRLLTLLLFAWNCYLMRRASILLNEEWKPYAGALLFGIPFIGVCYAMALSEVPGMLCLTASFLLLAPAFSDAEKSPSYPTARLLMAGILFGLAAWGRQNYIVILPILSLCLYWNKASWAQVLAFSAPSALMVGWLFIQWGGVVPPFEWDARVMGANVIQMNPRSLWFSLGLTGILFLFLFPDYLKGSLKVLLGCVAVAALLVFCFPELRTLPSQYLLQRLVGETIARHFSIVYSIGLSTLALWLLFRTSCHLWANRQSPWIILTGLSWLAILASNMKIIHQFSSRYVVVAVPLILLFAISSATPGRWIELRLLIGFFITIVLAINGYKS